MNIAVIPARGGSKRIPDKNIRLFFGKPMIAYAIEAALKSKVFDRVVVSTDSERIAEIAVKYGAEVPYLRNSDLANDYAGTLPVIADAIMRLGDGIDCVCCVYPTVPLLQPEDLSLAYRKWKKKRVGFLVAATNYRYPIFRSFTHNNSDGLSMLYPEHYNTRSQDLPVVYHDAGLFYFASPVVWRKSDRIYMKETELYLLPENQVCDIDTEDDWVAAEKMMSILNSSIQR